MWSDAGGGGGSGGGGGFNTSYGADDGAGYGTQAFSSPGGPVGARKGGGKRIENVLPLTVRSVLQLDENNQEYLGTPVNMVTLVGLIREVDVTSTKITYTLDDTTGTIRVIKWIDSENQEEDPLMENTYCRAHGTFKTHQGNKQLLALHLEPVTNLNWVTAHILEVVHAALQLKRLSSEAAGMGKGGGGAMSGSMVGFGALAGPGMSGGDAGGGGGGGGALAGLNLTSQQQMVFEMIRSTSDDSMDSGYSREHLKAKLKGKVNPQHVDNALFFLSSEGHIYTTVDEDHFKATDG